VDPRTSDSDERSTHDRAEPIERRDFLGSVSTLAMAGGLAAGYGTFFVMAGRFLYPDADPGAWYFVARAQDIAPEGSIAYESPRGVRVVVRRRAEVEADRELTAEDFAALSSVCPHLGCRVHWEPHNNRFFCPCHNGVFDPTGRATAGPPKAANQSLPRYPLRVEHGLLFIQMPTQVVGSARHGGSLARLGSGRRKDLA